MKGNVIKRAWQKYRSRKSIAGIVLDFIFLAAVITVACPPMRRGMLTYILRVTLIEPEPYDRLVYLNQDNDITLKTMGGMDTTLDFPSKRPMLINIGSIWSPQTRAELRSLNSLAGKYSKWIDVIFISTDEEEETGRYIKRKRYNSIKTVLIPNIEEKIESWKGEEYNSLVREMLMSEPASMLIDKDGKVIIKKTGAARWRGDKVDKIVMEMLIEGRTIPMESDDSK